MSAPIFEILMSINNPQELKNEFVRSEVLKPRYTMKTTNKHSSAFFSEYWPSNPIGPKLEDDLNFFANERQP